MENLVAAKAFWRDKKVLVTGHTGFKGVWLCQFLNTLGARVYGYSLPPETRPNLFSSLPLAKSPRSYIGDIRDRDLLGTIVKDIVPEIIFHLAAQPLVRRSYRQPLLTIETNALGTANIIDAALELDEPLTLVCVTTDKCYQNNDASAAFVESDPLGGKDPYSASKACAELIVTCMRDAFCQASPTRRGQVNIVSARCGNVIGGGDWSEDRIVPDFIRAMVNNETLTIRMPYAVRPWIHVLDAVWAYMMLAMKTHVRPESYSGPWNFSPQTQEHRTVLDLIKCMASHLGDAAIWEIDDKPIPREARQLSLDSSKAKALLGWSPLLDFAQIVEWTARWYSDYNAGNHAQTLVSQQIDRFLIDA